MYFRDGKRRTDYVLAYRFSTSKYNDQNRRLLFLNELAKQKIEIEVSKNVLFLSLSSWIMCKLSTRWPLCAMTIPLESSNIFVVSFFKLLTEKHLLQYFTNATCWISEYKYLTINL